MMLFVTGIPVNERMLKEEHGQDYIDYARRVPIFIPFFGGGHAKPKEDTSGKERAGPGQDQTFSGEDRPKHQ